MDFDNTSISDDTADNFRYLTFRKDDSSMSLQLNSDELYDNFYEKFKTFIVKEDLHEFSEPDTSLARLLENLVSSIQFNKVALSKVLDQNVNSVRLGISPSIKREGLISLDISSSVDNDTVLGLELPNQDRISFTVKENSL